MTLHYTRRLWNLALQSWLAVSVDNKQQKEPQLFFSCRFEIKTLHTSQLQTSISLHLESGLVATLTLSRLHDSYSLTSPHVLSTVCIRYSLNGCWGLWGWEAGSRLCVETLCTEKSWRSYIWPMSPVRSRCWPLHQYGNHLQYGRTLSSTANEFSYRLSVDYTTSSHSTLAWVINAVHWYCIYCSY